MIWGKLGHVTGSVWTPLDRGRAGPPRTTMSKRGHGDWEREIEKTQPEQTFRHKEAFGLNVSAEIGFSPTTSRVKVNNFQNGPFPIWLIVINHQKTRYTHKLTGTKYSFASPDLCLKGHTHLSVFLPPRRRRCSSSPSSGRLLWCLSCRLRKKLKSAEIARRLEEALLF